MTFRESELVAATMSETQLTGCRFLDVRFVRLDAIGFTAAESTWCDSEIVSSRLGAASVYGSAVRSLRLTDCKVGYLNLRGSLVTDLVIEDSTVEELDLGEAEVVRASFAGTSIDTLTLRNARLLHVDLRGARLGEVSPATELRGATIDHAQLMDLAPTIAVELGIDVR